MIFVVFLIIWYLVDGLGSQLLSVCYWRFYGTTKWWCL